ncbi:MAG: Kae1-associated serine/threonine protein kinase [Candidatus Methanoplasma sp.]|jgi:TP53 regulating kinase-like protein/N6-L-threonylcarbamoyladenine synthase/protein kinase Bud32|nr:Kae1-associated serine/threonine protein kinase [Candidatus Methanoplasma sp.]
MQSYGDPIASGAEADVFDSEYLGRKAVAKVRSPKRYRHPELDSKIRSSRMRNEVRLMRDARRAGVRTPVVYDVDIEECSIVMEKVQGVKIKDVLDSGNNNRELCDLIGKTVADLHNAGICHGDLTTSNMILTDDGKVCLIDFSMGRSASEIEDIGVDIRLLERAFSSAHPGLGNEYKVLIDAYIKRKERSETVMKKVEEIKNRGRYT